jgi:arylsulfatase A-like enzyme
MLAVDTLRADHLGCYGYDQPTSPFIDSLAARSVLYEHCFSHAPWTIPSFTSIMSGLDPIRSRVVSSPWNVPNYKPVRFDDTALTLAEALREVGYFTYAVDNLVEMASHPSWFVRGFHRYVNLTDRLSLRQHHVLAEQCTDEVLSCDLSRIAQPWFAFVHYWDPHQPYNYPKRYDDQLKPYRPAAVIAANGREYLPRRGYSDEVSEFYLQLIAQYDRSILYLDDELRRLCAGLDHTGALDDTIIVLFGDHGEAMVEHGVLFRHSLLYDPTIHVPMIIHDPRSGQMGRVADFVQHHDLAPTLMELIGVAHDWPVSGRTMPPFGIADERSFTVSTQDGGAAMRALRTECWKLICHYDLECPADRWPADVRRFELYDIKADPFELVDRSDELPDVGAELLARLEGWRRTMLADGQSDPLLESELRVDFSKYPEEIGSALAVSTSFAKLPEK